MRDPERIDPLLAELAAVWGRYPDLRLGQLVAMVALECRVDPFYLEDDRLRATLAELPSWLVPDRVLDAVVYRDSRRGDTPTQFARRRAAEFDAESAAGAHDWRDLFLAASLAARGLRERLRLLAAFGLTDYDVAKVVPTAGPRSVRRWRTAGVPVTGTAARRWEPIDDLCATIGYLLANVTLDREAIVEWLRSRNEALDGQRPLDALSQGKFDSVRAAAVATLPRDDSLTDGPAA